MICKTCGKSFPDDYKYCPYCGGQILEHTDNLEDALYLQMMKSESEIEAYDLQQADSGSRDSCEDDSQEENSGKDDSQKEDSYKEDSYKEDSYKEDSYKEDSYKEDSGKEDPGKKGSREDNSQEEDSYQGNTEEGEFYDEDSDRDDPAYEEEQADSGAGKNARNQKNGSDKPLPKKEHKALTVFKTILSVILMTGLLVCTMGAACILTVRLSLTKEAVRTQIDTVDMATLQVGTWMGEEEDDTLSEYIYRYVDHSYLSQADVEDVLRSEEFQAFAADKIYSCINYIYNQRGEASITAEELAAVFAPKVRQNLEASGSSYSDETVRGNLAASFEEAGIEKFSMSREYGHNQNLMDTIHFMTAYTTLAICIILGIILIILLFLLNGRYRHKLFLYYGIPLTVTGSVGCIISLFRGQITRTLSAITLFPVSLLQGLVFDVAGNLLSASLAMLAAGVFFFLIFLICRIVLRKREQRLAAKNSSAVSAGKEKRK